MTKLSITRAPAHKRGLCSSLQRQKAISQLGRAMASKLSLDAVFREFAAGIKGYIPYHRLLISRVNPQNRIQRIFIISPSSKDTLDVPGNLYEKGKSVTEWLVWDIEPDLPPLTTDAGKVEAILQNLVVNAFKYTTEGEVKIRMKNRPESKSVELVVEDTGRGIASEELPRVFDGFHQVHSTAASQGVGLGLTIVKKYLELIKGNIQVKSKLGEGSTFTVTLPYKLQP